MKFTAIILAVAFSAPFASFAQDDRETEGCEVFANLASSVMRARQAGVTLSDALAVSRKTDNVTVAELNTKLVLMAYDRPRYSTEGFKQREVDDFRNEVHMACIRAGN